MKPFPHKTWTRLVLASLVLLVGGTVIVNMVVDAYGIFRTDFSRQPQGIIPNMNYIKMNYLLKHRDRYDSFIFGSSRVENIEPVKIPDGRYYNMTYALGLPEEHLANVKFLLQNGVAVKNLLIGIDEFSYQVDPAPRRTGLMTQPLPAISGKPIENFYGEYFFKLREIVPQAQAYIRHNYTHRNDPLEQHTIYDMFGSGRLFCRKCDDEIERDPQKHARRFLKPAMYFNADFVDTSLATIRELVSICRENNIHLVLFISPSPQITYLNTDLGRLARYKKQLAAITPFYDFSGLNSVTRNPSNFYEPLHYRPIVGDMILNVIYGIGAAAPSDFGSFVTAETVNSNLERQCREIRQISGSMKLIDVNAAYAAECGAAAKPVSASADTPPLP